MKAKPIFSVIVSLSFWHCADPFVAVSLPNDPHFDCMVSIENDWGLDGTVNERIVHGYDEAGNRVVHDREYYGDFSSQWCGDRDLCVELPIIERTTFSYDQDGNVVSEKLDDGRDGTVELHNSWVFDQHGNEIRYQANHDDDETIEIIDTFDYDDHGHLQEYSRSTLEPDNSYSTKTSVWVLTYDADGRVLTSKFDEGSRGEFGRCTVNSYADAGLATTAVDWNCDGSSRLFSYQYEYDGNGVLVGKDYDRGMDGVDERWRWQYDNDGNETLFEHHADGSGTVDHSRHSTYDAAGRLMSVEVATTSDDVTTTTRSTYSYDPSDRLERIDIDQDADDEVDVRVTYEYSAGCDRSVVVPDAVSW